MRSIFITIICLAAIINIQAQKVTISLNTPAMVESGKIFPVEITINKYDLQSYAELICKVPKGFIVKKGISANGELIAENQTLKATWLKFPASKELKLTMEIEVPLLAKDSFLINCELTYLVNNVRGLTKAASKKIAIVKPIKPVQENNILIKPIYSSIRQLQYDESKKIYTAFVVLKKGNYKGKAVVKEQFQEGYKLGKSISLGAKITEKKNALEFTWNLTPPDSVLTINYELIPDKIDPTKVPVINGEFIYAEGKNILRINTQESGLKIVNRVVLFQDKDIENFFNAPDSVKK